MTLHARETFTSRRRFRRGCPVLSASPGGAPQWTSSRRCGVACRLALQLRWEEAVLGPRAGAFPPIGEASSVRPSCDSSSALGAHPVPATMSGRDYQYVGHEPVRYSYYTLELRLRAFLIGPAGAANFRILRARRDSGAWVVVAKIHPSSVAPESAEPRDQGIEVSFRITSLAPPRCCSLTGSRSNDDRCQQASC